MGGEIIFIIPGVLGFAAVVTAVGTVLVWLVWRLVRRRRKVSQQRETSRFPIVTTVAALLAISLPSGCFWASRPVPQPASQRTVAAYEVPLPTAQDRADFLTIIAAEAAVHGLDVRVETPEEMAAWARMSPDLRRSLHASIFRGGDLHKTEAEVSDRFHLGHAWIHFARGDDPELARRFRDGLMARLVQRWPEILRVPVAQTGSLPHREDLIVGSDGYEIDPAKMAGYICGDAPGNAPRSACE